MSDEIRTAADLRASIVDQRGGIERFDGPQRRLLDALVFELAKKPNEIDVSIVTDLTALLPQPVSVPERDNHPDPRLVMFKIYMEMRERGEVPPEGWHQHRIDAQAAEIAALKAQLVGAGLVPALPDANSSARRTNLAIDPAEVVPPGEWRGETYAGPRAGPDDPPKPRVTDGKANPPAARAAPPPRPAWEDWLDAGAGVGPGYDRWADNR